MEKLNEISSNSLKFRVIDPYGEEDWNEYEIKNDDEFYFFTSKDNEILPGIGNAILKNDIFTIKIKNFPDKSLINKVVKFNDDIKQKINKNQFAQLTTSVKSVNKYKIIALVNNFKFNDYYKNIHELIRKYIYNTIKKLNSDIVKIEKNMDSLEEKTIVLKKNLKSLDEFPHPDEFKLAKNEYIVIEQKKDNNGNIDININIYELSEEPDDKGGYHLINKETGEKGPYILKTFNKLKETGYLLLRTKSNPDYKKFISKEELYGEFIKKIVEITNNEIKKEVDENRSKYREYIKKVDSDRDELTKLRETYLNFKFSDVVNKLKDMDK